MEQDANESTAQVVSPADAAGTPGGPAARPGPMPGPATSPRPAQVTGAGDLDQDTQTGDAAVDSALRPLESLAGRPVREHVAVFDALHGALSDRLAETRE